MTQIQRDARCVQRAAWLMAGLAALAMAVLAYLVLLLNNFPYNAPHFIVNLICALGLGALISLLAFMVLGMYYRMKLDQRREECRQLVTRLLESRLGAPVTPAQPEDFVVGRDRNPVQSAYGGNDSALKD